VIFAFGKLAIPNAISAMLMFIPSTVNLMIAGHLEDPALLAAVGIGVTTCALVVLSFLTGLNGAQETLTSQAFGNGEIELCGVYLNRGRLINIVFATPLLLLAYLFGEELLLLLQQDEEVSKMAGQFIRTQLPGFFLASQFDLVRRWLVCMRRTTMPLVSSIVGVALHVPLALYFVNTLGFGIYGFGIVTVITGLVQLTMI
jgi:MATE family multidrug resistance protein